MIKLFALLLWWVQRLAEQMESIAANLSKELITHIDHYRLPIYDSPFIEAETKPPAVA